MSQPADTLSPATGLGSKSDVGQPALSVSSGLRRLISGASLILSGTMVSQVANFIFNAVGAHSLGPARYGVLAASMALLSFGQPLLAAVQSVASRATTSLAQHSQLRKVRGTLWHYGLRVVFASLVLGGIAVLGSRWIARLFHLGSPWLVVVVGVVIPAYMIGHLLGGFLQGVERFGRFAAESVVEGLTKAIVGVLAMTLVWRSALGGMTAIAVSCASGLITYVVLTVPVLDRGSLAPVGVRIAKAAGGGPCSHRRKARRGMPGVLGYSATALGTYGLLALMLSSDTLIAKHYLSNYQAGLYAGVSLAGKIAYFATSSFFVIAFPVFSRHHDQGLAGERWVLVTAGVVCGTAGAIAAVLAIEPNWVVRPLLGQRYQGAERYVAWMAAIFGLYALGYLMSIYLLARKRKGVVAVLTVAAVVEFAGFFAEHSSTPRLMQVLALAFAVMTAGNAMLILLDARRSGRGTASAVMTDSPSSLPTGEEIASRDAAQVPGPRNACHEQIVNEVTRQVGAVPVLLAGSRALGTAHAESDYDVSVVLPLPRIPRAVPRLAATSRSLTADLGAPVSVNAVPAFRMRHPGGSLYVRKLRAEGIVLDAPGGWSLRREPVAGISEFGASSVLISATRSLLENFDTAVMREGLEPAKGHAALRKAALHVAQARLLRSGEYASRLSDALDRLRSIPADRPVGPSGAELAAELASCLAADPVLGFLRLRDCVLEELAEVSDEPFSLPMVRRTVRNAQYAVLAHLRGRRRWRIAFGRTPVERRLAATQLELLRSLDPSSAEGVNAARLRRAHELCPTWSGGRNWLTWEALRDQVLTEWLDAHPLVGLLA